MITAEFDWCHFCQNDDRYTSKCKECSSKGDEIPTEFKEKESVTAYRKAVEVQNG